MDGDSDDFLQSLLQHYVSRCTNVEDLLTWLLTRSRPAALLGTELMAEGLEFNDAHAQRCSEWLDELAHAVQAHVEAERWWEAAVRIVHPTIVHKIESILRSETPSSDATMAALLRFNPDRAADLLEERATSPLETVRTKLRSAARLVGVGAQYTDAATRAVSALVDEPAIRPRSIRGLVLLYGTSLPDTADRAVVLLQRLDERATDPAERIHIAIAVDALAADRGVAVDMLVAIAADLTEPPLIRLRSLQ